MLIHFQNVDTSEIHHHLHFKNLKTATFFHFLKTVAILICFMEHLNSTSIKEDAFQSDCSNFSTFVNMEKRSNMLSVR